MTTSLRGPNYILTAQAQVRRRPEQTNKQTSCEGEKRVVLLGRTAARLPQENYAVEIDARVLCLHTPQGQAAAAAAAAAC